MSSFSNSTAESLLALEIFLGHSARRRLLRVSSFLLVAGVLVLAYIHYLSPAPVLAMRILGVLFLLVVVWIVCLMLEAYFRSLHAGREAYWLAAYNICKEGQRNKDYLIAFAHSRPGYEILLRLGMTSEAIDALIRLRETKAVPTTFIPSVQATTSLTLLAEELFSGEPDLEHALFKVAALQPDFRGATAYVVRAEALRKEAERWWSKERLQLHAAIGKDWAFASTPYLDLYSSDVSDALPPDNSSLVLYERQISRLEAALSRTTDANAMLLGKQGDAMNGIVAGLSQKILQGTTTAELAHKRPVLFRGMSLVSALKDKGAFEEEFSRIMEEASGAGNIVLIFDDFGNFYSSAQALGSDVSALLSPYLASRRMQIVLLSDLGQFHAFFEQNALLMSMCEKIQIMQQSTDETLLLITDLAHEIESKSPLVFTYPALVTVVESADRYLTEGIMPDKAADLLMDVASTLVREGDSFISREDVLHFVSLKTSIPVGAIGSEEKERLEHLEEYLHARVVGQEGAITAVATALRRVRSGIKNPNRPVGTFLFLGPTGVGKTETAKALAEAYFGGEGVLMRLDMNQYKEVGAIDRLIGSFASGKPGILTSMIRDKKYGVLLLDEFEKASQDVKDLFLQLLDEGVFADMHGEKVNARNLIFIATSNAGSDAIFKIVQSGGKMDEHKEEITHMLIAHGVMKPELMNRFDGVIFFEPLSKEHIYQVAELMLKRLQSRLREKGIDFIINQATRETVVGAGYDPKFGARPMNRAIQDRVEGLIARKIIAGELPPGSRIELSAADFM